MTKPIFYEGQQVGCLMSGEGVVLEINENMATVRFEDWVDDYFKNGAWLQHQRPTLYPIEQYRAIIATLPAPEPEKWQPKPGEWCWFWTNSIPEGVVLARFEQEDNNTYMAKIHSWISCYDYCAPFVGELPEHLKEVQP